MLQACEDMLNFYPDLILLESWCCCTHPDLLSVFVRQVTKLQSDISPLHHSLSVLSEKNGSLQADRRILEDDLKRWKAKTQVRARVCVAVC